MQGAATIGAGAARQNVPRMLHTAEEVRALVWQRIEQLPDMEDRTGGGYLCVADLKGQPLVVVQMGAVPEARLKRYYTNAIEKAQRLAVTFATAEHRLSRQSRDEARERWGGAVAGKNYIFSFSGLPEDADEILVLLLAMRLDELTPIDAESLAKNPRNDYYECFDDQFFVKG